VLWGDDDDNDDNDDNEICDDSDDDYTTVKPSEVSINIITQQLLLPLQYVIGSIVRTFGDGVEVVLRSTGWSVEVRESTYFKGPRGGGRAEFDKISSY